MSSPSFDGETIVVTLALHGVRFVVIGGWAVEAHGVAYSTNDVDIIIEPSVTNVATLCEALAELDATYLQLPGSTQRIRPTVERIAPMTGTALLQTRCGRLDVMKESGGHTYASLTASKLLVATIGNCRIPIASLAFVADMKIKAGREKDKRALPAIMARLRELEGERD